uniref:Collagen type IV alpha-3-binding protein n=1 Tax=Panagrolaimus sp. JU765 TaxID=591449 RepID=A0AC34RKF8_9BILA
MTEISLQGNIFKYTNFLYGYQERYFKIENGNILYYLNRESVKDGCRKYRQLFNFAIEVDENDSRRFDIVFPDERWCLRFKSEDESLIWKNALRAFLVSPVPNRSHSVDMHKLAIMAQNMDAQYDHISNFLEGFLGSRAEPVDLTTIEQTIDRCRQLEHNLKQLRALLRMQQVKESIMSEDEWHDADDGDIRLDQEMINEIQKDLAVEKEQQPSGPVLSPLWKEISDLTAEQVKYAKTGVDVGIWELFCEDGAMKMYKREMESEDGLMVDPLKAVHHVKGISAREYIDCFFKPEYKPEWDDTLVKLNVVDKLDEYTFVLHQLHKKVWPAAQRESLFWTHFENVTDQREHDAIDAFVVCNHNVERDDVPLTDGSCVRVGLTIAMLCQTTVSENSKEKTKEELTREDIQCRIYYVAQVHPGGWVPTAALRQVYKREYPRFLRTFTNYVVKKVGDRPLEF